MLVGKTGTVEAHRMEIDPAIARNKQDESGWRFIHMKPVAQRCQRASHRLHLIEVDLQVKIIVRARLLLEQRINTPTAIDRHKALSVLQTRENVGGFHHNDQDI